MNATRTAQILILGFLALAGGLVAQQKVHILQDLIGARGRDGETQLQERGYTWARTDKSSGQAYSFWRDNRTGRCVRVLTSDGRYAEIVYTSDADCEGGENASAGSDERRDEFPTVCGVAFEGKIHPNRCKAVDIYDGDKKTKTEVHFPDQTVTLKWQGPNKVAVHVEGLETRHAEYRHAGDDINWFLDDKTYFYTPDKEVAKKKLAELK